MGLFSRNTSSDRRPTIQPEHPDKVLWLTNKEAKKLPEIVAQDDVSKYTDRNRRR